MVKTETKHSDAEQLVRSKLDELIQFRSQTDDIKDCLLYTSPSPRDSV